METKNLTKVQVIKLAEYFNGYCEQRPIINAIKADNFVEALDWIERLKPGTRHEQDKLVELKNAIKAYAAIGEPEPTTVAEPVAEPETEPVVEQEPEPVAEPETEPVVEQETEPETEPVAEPESETPAEPVVETLAETPAELTTEPEPETETPKDPVEQVVEASKLKRGRKSAE